MGADSHYDDSSMRRYGRRRRVVATGGGAVDHALRCENIHSRHYLLRWLLIDY